MGKVNQMRDLNDRFCILTINDDGNYGNRLQNYALQELLKEYGPVTTVHMYLNAPNEIILECKRLKHGLSRAAAYIMLAVKGRCHAEGRRKLNFLHFTRQFVPDNQAYASDHGVFRTKFDNRVRKVVIGSDQVWNYTFGLSKNALKLRLGAPFPSEKLFSYAASIGLNKIDDDWKLIFHKYLNRIPAISVREEKAKELVESVSDRQATVVLDPTLMVPAKKWRKIFPGFVPDNDRYVLTYFLGKPSDHQEQVIERYANEHGLRIRRINDFSDPETYPAGPREFVELFAKAQYVFTDSYHACCFSLIFGKDFKVYSRNTKGMKNMNSRMQTLFHLFNLDTDMNNEEELPTYDHEYLSVRLAELQKQSRNWLDSAIAM